MVATRTGGGRAEMRPAVSFSPAWSAVALGSVLVLAVAAPGGLYLIGFLGIIIVSHEAGHLLAARRAGIEPTEFFWGFGPEVLSIDIGTCRYGLKALFLGGYVKLEGMTPSSEPPDRFPEGLTYRAATHRGRLATILAGPAVNLVMAAVAFGAAAVLDGQRSPQALVTGVGDVWFVVAATGEALWLWVSNIGLYWAALFDGSGSADVPVRFLSPVAQADVSRQAVGLGLGTSLQWFGILSAAIGALNLVPLPPLDGSHALVAGGEWLAQRLRGDRSIRLDVRRLLPLAYVTVGLLLALSATALVLDIRDLA